MSQKADLRAARPASVVTCSDSSPGAGFAHVTTDRAALGRMTGARRSTGRMTRITPLPAEFAARPFRVAEALASGVTPSRLRAGDLLTPTRGVRVARSVTLATPARSAHHQDRLRADLLERAAAVAPALTPDQFFSHGTALALLGAPLPYLRATAWELHVSARRPAGQPRREGVVGHRLQARAPARGTAHGLPIEHPARAWRQAARTWDLDDVIAAADHLVCPRHRIIAPADLRAEIADAGDLRGGFLTRALAEVRVGAETAEETHVRLLLIRAGLPEPSLNHRVQDSLGRFIARLDLAYPGYRVAVEHDGRTHAFDEQQFAKDADRWDAIRDEGWLLVRILSHHLRPDPRRALAKVTDALIARGWRPGVD